MRARIRGRKSHRGRWGVESSVPIGVAALLALALSGSASAVDVFFEFEARVDSTNTDFVSVGDTFTGSFGYDTDTPLAGPTSSNFYLAPHDADRYGVNLSIGPDGPITNVYNVGISQSFAGTPRGADYFGVSSFGPVSATDWPAGSSVNFQLGLIDESGSVFPDLVLPSHLDLSDFDTGQIVIMNTASVMGDPGWRFDSEIISLRVIPEPSTGVLMGLGLLVLARRRRADLPNPL